MKLFPSVEFGCYRYSRPHVKYILGHIVGLVLKESFNYSSDPAECRVNE